MTWFRENTAPVIGLIVVISCFALFVVFAKGHLDPGNKEIILMVLGAAITTLSQVIGYYFGSSQGSTRKTEILAGTPPPEELKAAVLTTGTALIRPGPGEFPGIDAGPQAKE